MELMRIIRHLTLPDWWVRRPLSTAVRAAIERAIADSEVSHRGELRFVAETDLPLPALLRGDSARERAIEIFSRLGVWDTEENSGVLIYVQLVDRRVEILADRGINARVPQSEWDAICRRLEQAYRRGAFEAGTVAAIGEISALLRRHFPAAATNPNELPDRPLVL